MSPIVVIFNAKKVTQGRFMIGSDCLTDLFVKKLFNSRLPPHKRHWVIEHFLENSYITEIQKIVLTKISFRP